MARDSKEKYVKNQCLSQIKHKHNLLKVRELYMVGRKIIIGNGVTTDFWNDKWCGDFSLYEKFNELYEICREQRITVAEAAAKR